MPNLPSLRQATGERLARDPANDQLLADYLALCAMEEWTAGWVDLSERLRQRASERSSGPRSEREPWRPAGR